MLRLFFSLFILLIFSSNLKGQNAQIDHVDFTETKARIRIEPDSAKVSGKLQYSFDILKETDTIFIDARNMKFWDVSLNDKKIDFLVSSNTLAIVHDFQPSKNNQLHFSYSAYPKSAMYFINWDVTNSEAQKQVWTQGQGRYTSNWLPSFDEMQEKLIFDLTVEFPTGYEVIANGTIVEKSTVENGFTSWQYDMENPMSSYLVAIAAGDFSKKNITSSTGDSITLFITADQRSNLDATYRYTSEMFDFLEEEIGVPYPWVNYKQVPVQDFLYSGMENTTTTIFANSLVVDSIGFNDHNYVMVNAHELAHQWFGNLVTEENGEHHWLQEGFATYYALLAEREIFGDDYYYWKLYESAEKLKALSDSGKGESLLNPKASSLTFYQKGAWALHILREEIGDEAFRNGIKNYLEKYQFSNVNTEDFLLKMEAASGMDLTSFRKNWLKQSAFKAIDALSSLKKSIFMTYYLELAGIREFPLEQKFPQLDAALDAPYNDYIVQEAVNQLKGNYSAQAIELYQKAFRTTNLYARQAVALNLENIPATLKDDFETLLDDDSYVTREVALLKLWSEFPANRTVYLEKMKGQTGFFNKNIRMLWLTLSLATPEYKSGETEQFYAELSGYTEAWRPFEVRQNAFGYLYQLESFDDASLKSLIQGTAHHTYSFRNFCRRLLDVLWEKENFRSRIDGIAGSLDSRSTAYLNSKSTN